MKKRIFFCLFAAALATFSLSSCTEKSGDDQDNPGGGGGGGDDTPSLHLKNYVTYNQRECYSSGVLLYTKGNDVSGFSLRWEGNRISDYLNFDFENGSLTERPSGIQFTYDGDVLTEIIDPWGSTVSFTYENGRFSEMMYEESSTDWEKMIPTYNDNGKIQEIKYTSSDGDNSRYVFDWIGDNITTIQLYENGSLQGTYEYTYDNKHSAYSTVPIWYILLAQEFPMLSANNVATASHGSNVITFNYTYHNDYPEKCECLRVLTTDTYTFHDIQTIYFEYEGSGIQTLPQFYQIDVEENDFTKGSVSGGGIFTAGSTATFFAEAYEGYEFESWNDGNTDNPRAVTVTENATYTANFSSPIPPQQGEITAVFDGTELDVSGWLDGLYSTSAYEGLTVWLLQAASNIEGNSVYFPFIVCWLEGQSATELSIFTANSNPLELYKDTFYSTGSANYGDWQYYSTNYFNVTNFDLDNHTISFSASFEMYSMEDIVDNNVESPDEATKKTLELTVTNFTFSDADSKGNMKKLQPKR